MYVISKWYAFVSNIFHQNKTKVGCELPKERLFEINMKWIPSEVSFSIISTGHQVSLSTECSM